MGAWGPGIKQNDTFLDVYNLFIQYYNDGIDLIEISQKLKESLFPGDVNDYVDSVIALAYAQWMTKSLQPDILKRVEDILIDRKGLELWEEAGEKELKKRIVIITKFIEQIKSERPIALKRKKVPSYPAPFKKGDCIIFKIDEENYSGAYVYSSSDISSVNKEGWMSIALLRIKQKTKPTTEDLLNAEILYTTYRHWNHGYNVNGFGAKDMRKKVLGMELIGNISFPDEITHFLQFKTRGSGFNFDYWNTVEEIINSQFEFEEKNGSPDIKKFTLENILNDLQPWKVMMNDRYQHMFDKNYNIWR